MKNFIFHTPFVPLPRQILRQFRLTTKPEQIRKGMVIKMLNIRDLKIDPASLGAKKLLVDITPAYEYKDGHRSDTITGYRYIVALPEHSLEKIGVKIEGKQLLEKPEGFAEVEFSGLEVFAYESQGKTQISAKAAGISLVNRKP